MALFRSPPPAAELCSFALDRLGFLSSKGQFFWFRSVLSWFCRTRLRGIAFMPNAQAEGAGWLAQSMPSRSEEIAWTVTDNRLPSSALLGSIFICLECADGEFNSGL